MDTEILKPAEPATVSEPQSQEIHISVAFEATVLGVICFVAREKLINTQEYGKSTYSTPSQDSV